MGRIGQGLRILGAREFGRRARGVGIRLLLGRERGVRARILARLVGRSAPPEPAPEQTPPPPAGDDGWVVALPLHELPDDEPVEVVVDGHPIALCRVDGALHAVDATCPHAGGPVADGTLHDGILTCPWHGWGFDVRTGRCTVSDDASLARWPVKASDGRILVRVDGEPA